MTQLAPPVTTATGTLTKVYRKVAMPKRKARGIAKSFLKGSSRPEEQQDTCQTPPGNRQTSAPTRRHDPGAVGKSKNFIVDQQRSRQGFTEDSPAGRPTAEAGGIGRGKSSPPAQTTVVPALARARKGTRPPSGIDQALDEGEKAFNSQIASRQKKIRDGRRRSNERHS